MSRFYTGECEKPCDFANRATCFSSTRPLVTRWTTGKQRGDESMVILLQLEGIHSI